MKLRIATIKKGILLFFVALITSCGAPKEGCPGETGTDYNKVDFTKLRKKKKAKSGLFSKKQKKRMRKKRGN